MAENYRIRVNDYTPEAKKRILLKMIEALTAVGFFLEGDVRRRIRKNESVDTAQLVETIDYDIDKNKYKVRIGSPLKYAIYVEKGTGIYAVDGDGRQTPWVYFYDGRKGDKGWRYTVGQKPAPFLTPAGEENIDTVIRIIKNILSEI